jgi:hypothetical protein
MPMNQEQLLEVQQRLRAYQERADKVFEPWGLQAPAPVVGEDPGDYRRRLAILAKRQLPDNHKLRQLQIRRLDDETLNAFEPQIYQACRTEAMNPNTIPPGQFRMVTQTHRDGYKENRFIGPVSFVKDMSIIRGRVTGFRALDGSGFVDLTGTRKR